MDIALEGTKIITHWNKRKDDTGSRMIFAYCHHGRKTFICFFFACQSVAFEKGTWKEVLVFWKLLSMHITIYRARFWYQNRKRYYTWNLVPFFLFTFLKYVEHVEIWKWMNSLFMIHCHHSFVMIELVSEYKKAIIFCWFYEKYIKYTNFDMVYKKYPIP